MTDGQRNRYVLAGLLALAASVRVALLLWLDPVISNEGTEYLRLAQNLRAGAGYQGMHGQLNAIFPPLFPLLVAVVSPLAGGAEAAARLISVVLGTAAVLPVYGIGARLGGERAGLIAAALAALHGMLIALSVSTYAESTYFFLIACAIYSALQTTVRWRAGAAAASGALFGLAYLVKPEAIVCAGITAAFSAVALWRGGASLGRGTAVVGALIVAAGVIMTPYVIWLSNHSGYLRFEGKSGINGLLSERIHQGLTYHQAAQALGPNLEPVGAFLTMDEFVEHPLAGGIGSAIRTMSTNIPVRALSIVTDTVRTRALGGVPLLLLAAVGLVSSLARVGSRSAALLFAALGASYLPVLLTMEFRWTRHLFPVAVLLLPWAAAGTVALIDGLRSRVPARPALVSLTVTLACVGLIAGTSAYGASQLSEFTQMRDSELRDAGRWLAAQPPPGKLVAAIEAASVYYARGRELYLPWSSESQVQAYLAKLGPDFVALSSLDTDRAPYVADWLEHGIPGRCASLLRTFAGPGNTLQVYRWNCPATDRQWLNQWCPETQGVPACIPTRRYVQATSFDHP